MFLGTGEVARILIALAFLVITAHGAAYLFQIVKQPPVIGEILGGLLLGPTVLGFFAPGVQADLIPPDGPTAHALSLIYQLGLLLLVYLTGTELRGQSTTGTERRSIMSMSLLGLLIPFAAGITLSGTAGLDGLSGAQGSSTSIVLIFGMAIAITSIPVISRIMLDLGILGTHFARMVLSVAVLEDVVLYVTLAVVMGISGATSGDAQGFGALVSEAPLHWAVLYYTIAPCIFLALLLKYGGRIFGLLMDARWNILSRRSPAAYLMVFIFALCLACIGLGIDPIFGALVAGVCDARSGRAEDARETLRGISYSFFIPVYFALVGVKLDLIHHFDIVFFAWFLVFACVVKFSSVWLGARIGGQNNRSASNLAAAMNARGGPGIVLASVTFGAGIISEDFFSALVVLSIVTSQMAGVWLTRTLDRGNPLTAQDGPEPRDGPKPLEEPPPLAGPRPLDGPEPPAGAGPPNGVRPPDGPQPPEGAELLDADTHADTGTVLGTDAGTDAGAPGEHTEGAPLIDLKNEKNDRKADTP
ncbi:cation:proton antiporter [Streptomyces iconiensis]|uniref:Cation:proton antiporter n=1 Tax=Streptomyces iconiensis TaxID=1384038 RepID=A0ABT6ZN96_9ACTN|nr:cation:proton antiporter [Streptomyces iconiensis]MDJ1130534.1 cation:proton antiporter [Streptomyces iconiensis]